MPGHIQQLATIAHDVRGGKSVDQHANALQRSQDTLKYLGRNSHSAKWPTHVCKLLSHTMCFHLEEVDDATREVARGEMRCNLCGTVEENCRVVVHLGGNIDSYDAESFFGSSAKGLGDLYKTAAATDPRYLGVLVPGTSCLGLIVKTLTANNFIYNAINKTSCDLAADKLRIAKLWNRLTHANRRKSDYFYQLVSRDEDCSEEFQFIFDEFVASVISTLPDSLDSREQWLAVFRKAKLVTTSNFNRLSGAGPSSGGGGGGSRVEIEIDNSDEEDEEDDESDGDSFIVPSDEEDEEDEEDEKDEEEEEVEEAAVRAGVHRHRRVVDDDTSDEEEQEEAQQPVVMSVDLAVREPLPRQSRETRAGKRAREHREEEERRKRQQDLVVAGAAPSRAAAGALRQHPGNVLHSRVSTLQDLLAYASTIAGDNSADAVTLGDAAAIITRLIDGKKRGIDYGLNIAATSKTLSQLQTKMVTKGKVSETKPIASALLVLAEFA